MSKSGGKRLASRLRPTMRLRPTYFFGYSPIRAVRVSGHSMSPTLNWGDWVLFRRFHPSALAVSSSATVLANGQHHHKHERELRRISKKLNQKIVLIARLGAEGQRDLLQIKRVVRVERQPNGQIGIWVEGDNAAQSSDSRQWGYLKPDEIIGIYLTRYHLG